MTEDIDKVKYLLAKLMDVCYPFHPLYETFMSSPDGHETPEAARGAIWFT